MIVNALCRTYAFLGLTEDFLRAAGKDCATVFCLSQRRTASILETAKKFVSAAMVLREGGKDKFSELVQAERKKNLKFALSLLASPPPLDRIGKAFSDAGFAGSKDVAEACEAAMLAAGLRLAVRNAQPAAIMRAMTAFLGFDVFDVSEAWLEELLSSDESSSDILIMPGELPDLVLDFASVPGLLSQAFFLAGPKLAAAALAGCPRETAEVVERTALSPVGGRVLDAEILDARTRLSSDELADAQDAFCALLGSLREPARRPELAAEDGWGRTPDKGLAADLSELIMELDERALRAVVGGLDVGLAAALLQTMTPEAHDRVFSSVPPGRGKRILLALEAAAPLSILELTRKAQIFAQRVLAELAPRTRQMGKAFPIPARTRELLSAILSRE